MTESLVQCTQNLEDREENHYTFIANYENNEKRVICNGAYLNFKRKNFFWVEIVDMITHDQYQHKGYAEAMLRIMLRDIRNRNSENHQNTFLLVSKDNYKAIALYNKLGFRVAFERENYGQIYLVMVLPINSIWIYQLKSIDLVSLYD